MAGGIGKAAAWLMIGIVQLITLLILIPFGLWRICLLFWFRLACLPVVSGSEVVGTDVDLPGSDRHFPGNRFGVVADRKTGDEETAVPDRLDRQRDPHRHRCSADDDRIFQL